MKFKGFIYVALACMFWGTSGLFVNALSPFGLTSMHMTCIRGVVSAVFMIIYCLIVNREYFKFTKKQILLYCASGIGMFLTAWSYFVSMQASSVSTAVVLMYTAPIFVMIYSVTFLGEKFGLLKGISLLCMIIGCGLVSGIIGGLKYTFTGIGFGLLSGIAYSAYNIFTKIQMKHECKPITASMYCFIVMSVITLLLSKPVEIVSVAQNSPESIIIMIGCGLCTCVIPYFLYTLGLKELDAGTASSLGILEPMSAIILSVIFLDEKLDVFSITGIVLIITAVFMLGRTVENKTNGEKK